MNNQQLQYRSHPPASDAAVQQHVDLQGCDCRSSFDVWQMQHARGAVFSDSISWNSTAASWSMLTMMLCLLRVVLRSDQHTPDASVRSCTHQPTQEAHPHHRGVQHAVIL